MSDSSNPCGLYVLNDAGDPVPEPDTIAWGKWLAATMREGRHLAQDTIGPYWVSTVFLGVDHQFLDGGPPILWETKIFGVPEEKRFRGRRFRRELLQERYTSRADALAGHARAVKYAESLPAPVSVPGSADRIPPEAP